MEDADADAETESKQRKRPGAADKAGSGQASSKKARPPDEGSASTDDFESMTVAQLKERLKERELKFGGKKQELIDRLRSAGKN